MSSLGKSDVQKLNSFWRKFDMKFCSACQTTKEYVEFSTDRSKKDGVKNWCRPCSSERSRFWKASNPERESERQRIYRSENIDRIRCSQRERKRAWRLENPEISRERCRSQRMGGRDPLRPWPPGGSYKAAHQRPVLVWGPARNHACAECGDGANEWAYNHRDPKERAESVYDRRRGVFREILFSEHHSFYQPMCTSCHIKFDIKTAKARKGNSDA